MVVPPALALPTGWGARGCGGGAGEAAEAGADQNLELEVEESQEKARQRLEKQLVEEEFELLLGLVKAGSLAHGADAGADAHAAIRFAVKLATEPDAPARGAPPAAATRAGHGRPPVPRVLPMSTMMPRRRRLTLVLMCGIDGGAAAAALRDALDALSPDAHWCPDDVEAFVPALCADGGDAARVAPDSAAVRVSLRRCAVSIVPVNLPQGSMTGTTNARDGAPGSYGTLLFGWLLRRQPDASRIRVSRMPPCARSDEGGPAAEAGEVDLIVVRPGALMLRSLGAADRTAGAAGRPDALPTFTLAWRSLPAGVDLRGAESVSVCAGSSTALPVIDSTAPS